MSCVEWEREIAAEAGTPELAEHLTVCSSCRDFAHEVDSNRAALQALAVDPAALQAMRRGVLQRIESKQRRIAWWIWPAAAAACAAVVCTILLLPHLRNPAPPVPVEFAKNPPRIEWTPKAPQAVAMHPIHRKFGPVVAKAAPAQKPEPFVVKMLTADPNVIIIWLVDKKGDSL